MTRRMRVMFTGVLLLAAAVSTHRAAAQTPAGAGQPAPIFQVDPAWPALPNNWVMGMVSAVAVDTHDNVWILHRPRSGVAPENKERVAPPVVVFDARGAFVRAWGGDSPAYEWPSNEHGIAVDHQDNVWIGGSRVGAAETGKTDDMMLKFTADGKFLMQIGRRGQNQGNNDTKNFHGPADVFVYAKTNEAFIADGYGNHRLIVLDAATGAFKRMWGAFGNVPLDTPPRTLGGAALAAALAPRLKEEGPGPQQFGVVHGVKVSNDGLVYVGDRENRRIQVFTLDGKYVNQVFVNRTGPNPLGVGNVAFSPDPEQRFLYLADFGNSRLAVLERKTLALLYQFGEQTAKPGDFRGLHGLAVDSKGNLYTAEVAPGNRAQKLVFKGMSGPSTR